MPLENLLRRLKNPRFRAIGLAAADSCVALPERSTARLVQTGRPVAIANCRTKEVCIVVIIYKCHLSKKVGDVCVTTLQVQPHTAAPTKTRTAPAAALTFNNTSAPLVIVTESTGVKPILQDTVSLRRP
jgi:hypothetical protein